MFVFLWSPVSLHHSFFPPVSGQSIQVIAFLFVTLTASTKHDNDISDGMETNGTETQKHIHTVQLIISADLSFEQI